VKLESITVRNTGPFTDGVTVGPLAEGLNVLAARNEAGKTTLLMAAARALFDRHTVTGDAMERLRPAGTSLAPDVTVVFTAPEGRFRIHKTFLHAPASVLSRDRGGEWRTVADGDAADTKVLELIGGAKTGRGASKAEHWGLLRYLWARQGEGADWPAWDDHAGARIRAGLAQVPIDPLVERLADRFRELQESQFTATGRLAKNSPLQQAQQTRERLASELAAVRDKMEEIENQAQELRQRREELAVRARERSEAEEQAGALTAAQKAVELLQKDLERFQGDFDNARERLNEVAREKKTLDEAKVELEKAEKDLAVRQARESRADEAEKAARQALAVRQEDAKSLQTKLDLARRRESRMREIHGLRASEHALDALRRQRAAVHTQQQAVDRLRRERAGLPDVSKRQVTKLEQREREVRELAIRAESAGLRVAITPAQDAAIVSDRDGRRGSLDIAAGQTATVTATRSLRLDLPGWGSLRIASGAQEAAEMERRIGESRSAWETELKNAGVSSLDSARAIVEQIKDLDREIKAAEGRLAERLENWDDSSGLAAAVDRTRAEVEKARAQLGLSPAEAALSQTEWKAALAAIRTALEADEAAWTALQDSIETENRRLAACGAARSAAAAEGNDSKNRIAALQSRIGTIAGRYPDGVGHAQDSAQSVFVEAQARLAVARRKMPPDWEKLAARHERALKAVEQAAREHRSLQQTTRKLETLLEQAGSQGLYSRETRLQESLVVAEAECVRMQDHALAARFLAGLIDYRRKAVVSAVLKPLEDQLGAAFAEITGDHSRRVFLDENLHVAGIGRTRGETYAFDQLSQGAREQLLLALRAAVALELAKTGPQLLILDDVLVNTDAARQENVLDFIGNIARQVQILIVTCHGERYRGLGTSLEMEITQNPDPARAARAACP